MARNSQKEYVKDQLLEQGLSLSLIDEAMKNTGSYDLDIVLEYIEERRNKTEQEIESREEKEKKKKLKEFKERGKIIREEKILKQKLLEKIRADREEAIKERKREILAITEDSQTEKSVKIEPSANECEIKVLDIEKGLSYEFVFDQDASILVLLKAIEKETGVKDPEIFDGDELIEDDRRTLKEHGFYPFASLVAKHPE